MLLLHYNVWHETILWHFLCVTASLKPNLRTMIKRMDEGYPVVHDMFVALLWNNSVSAQRLFCR